MKNAKYFTIILISIWTSAASANVPYDVHYPITERHSADMTQGGAYRAGSFTAATVMGALGYNNSIFFPVAWESTITNSCTTNTKDLHPVGAPVCDSTGMFLWPQQCNPCGMARAMAVYTGDNWVIAKYPEAQQTNALNIIYSAVENIKSPVVVPIYGQADHWVTITKVITKDDGSLYQVWAYDGGPLGGADSNGQPYNSGTSIFGSIAWPQTYFKVLTAINPSCDGLHNGITGCTTDPYYHQFVFLYEPPAGQTLPSVNTNFVRAPGIATVMNEQIAQMHVWDALGYADMAAHPEIWKIISGGMATTAYHVSAVGPSGDPWEYYLVPIVSTLTGAAIAFVQLASDDGSFVGMHVPTDQIPFAPVSLAEAELLARGVLAKGERLTGGFLTWNPADSVQIIKSPNNPYYKFNVINNNTHKNTGVIGVTLNGGSVVRGQ